jgi:DNA-binding YbaB/EbfC family protein
MTDIGSLMKQAQGMQQKLAEAQAKLEAATVQGRAGGGLVTLTLQGSGALTACTVDPSLLADGDAETLQDLILAAHADAKARLDAQSKALMNEAMGPLAGLAGGLPGFPGLGR